MLMNRGVSIAVYGRQYDLNESTNCFMIENEDTFMGSVQVQPRARTSCVNRPAALVRAEGEGFVVAGRELEAVVTLHTCMQKKAKRWHTISPSENIVSLSVMHFTHFERPENLYSRAATSLENLQVVSYVHSFIFRVSVVAHNALLRTTRFPHSQYFSRA